jgi:DNA-binding transcriptional MerR regulator
MTDTIERQYWAINEVATELGVEASCIRYWCQEFGITTKRTSAQHRRFSLKEIIKLRVIHYLLYHEGFTIEGVKSKLLLMNTQIGAIKIEEEIRRQLSKIYAS